MAVPFGQPANAIRLLLNCGVLSPKPLFARKVLAMGSAPPGLVQAFEAALAM